MNRPIVLLRQLLPGLLPLIIFIAADEIWGTTTGLIVAIAVGLFQLIFNLYKGKGFDKFIVLDLGLIIAMGGISLWLNNDFFFKLKPVIINAILTVMLGAAAFLPGNIMLAMSQRYFKDIQIDPWQQLEFKKSMKSLFIVLVLFTLLSLWVVVYGTKYLWGLINGPGIFIVFGIFFVFEFYRKKLASKKYTNDEWLPLVNEEGKILGRAPRQVVHKNTKLLHPVVHLHVINKGMVYLQKRPLHKLVQPGKWDTAVGGHIGYGESIENSLHREAYEEIGLKDFKAQLVSQYIWESEIEKELVFTFITHYNGKLCPNPDEIDEGRFWSFIEIKENLGKGIFTPNFEKEFSDISTMLLLRSA